MDREFLGARHRYIVQSGCYYAVNARTRTSNGSLEAIDIIRRRARREP